MKKINLQDKLGKFSEPWSPKIVAALNGQHVKLAKCRGSFAWHRHENEDELFLVLDGRLKIHFRDRTEELGPGEFMVVPRGVEHCPEAEGEASVLLLEPETTRNTGDVDNAFTVESPDWI